MERVQAIWKKTFYFTPLGRLGKRREEESEDPMRRKRCSATQALKERGPSLLSAKRATWSRRVRTTRVLADLQTGRRGEKERTTSRGFFSSKSNTHQGGQHLH